MGNDLAKEKLTAVQKELEAATHRVTESQSSVSAAEESLKKYSSDMIEADSVLIDHQDQLAAFMVTMDTFNALKDRVTPPPPPPEPTTAAAETNVSGPIASAELER